MNRRKFLQILGLAAAAPAVVAACPPVTKIGIDFSNKADASVLTEWQFTQIHVVERQYYLPGSLKPDFVFPNKPIYPVADYYKIKS